VAKPVIADNQPKRPAGLQQRLHEEVEAATATATARAEAEVFAAQLSDAMYAPRPSMARTEDLDTDQLEKLLKARGLLDRANADARADPPGIRKLKLRAILDESVTHQDKLQPQVREPEPEPEPEDQPDALDAVRERLREHKPAPTLFFCREAAFMQGKTELSWSNVTRATSEHRILFAGPAATAELYCVGGGRRRFAVEVKDGKALNILDGFSLYTLHTHVPRLDR
jgi:hypothetical protein